MTQISIRRPAASGPKASRSPRIVEIEGLRGIALTLVVLFHLFGNGRVSGGVDVFLVISAFLLSRSIFRKATQAGGVRLAEHFGGVAARLVPPAALVLAAVGTVTLLLLPPALQRQNFQEILASALYYENWELINSQLAYGAAGPNTSPLQHFWSLSLQGQFFLAWPFIVLALVWVARRSRISALRVVLAVTIILTIASAVFAVYLTAIDQQVAYFHTLARFWELGAGAILGLTLSRIRLGSALRAVFIWSGLILVVSCGFFIDGGSLFPGPWTLWPVLGTLLVIVGAGTGGAPSSTKALGHPVLRFFARISYPLYLWHWPFLIFYLQVRDQDSVGWAGAAFIFGASVLLAWLTTVLVETPVARLRARLSPGRLAAIPLIATLVVTAGAGAAIIRSDSARAEQFLAMSNPSPENVGARALTEGIEPSPNAEVIPDSSVAFDDLPEVYSQGCIQNYRSEPGMDEVLVCESPVRNPTKTIVMSGGSHVQQWYPAVAAVAEQEGWAVIVLDKDGCRLALPDANMKQSASCESWNEKAIPELIALNPDAVFTVGSETASPEAAEEYTPEGQVEAWREIADAGIPVVTVRDTPRFSFRVPECVQAATSKDLSGCGIARGETYADESPFFGVADMPDGVSHLDLSDAFCTAERCEPVVGNVFVYRDDDHMTATYATTVAPALREALREAVPTLF